GDPHESPSVMTLPLIILAAFAILLGFIGTPAWPWFQKFLGHEAEGGFTSGVFTLMVISSIIVFLGIGLGYWLYGRKPVDRYEADPLRRLIWPEVYDFLADKYRIDELYERSIIKFNAGWSWFLDQLEYIA